METVKDQCLQGVRGKQQRGTEKVQRISRAMRNFV